MDNYCEQLVAKQKTAADTAKVVLTLAASVVLGSLIIIFALMTGLWVLIIGGLVIIGFGAWFAAGFGVEYEYILTNGEMDVDKIIGKRKRKRLITLDVTKTTIFEALPCADEKDAEVTVYATSGTETDAHYIMCEHRDYGTVKLIFNPDKKMKNAIGQELPPALRRKVINDVEQS